MQNAVRKYYFVSDLHMGGDGQLQQCDYTAEFIAFLKQLEKEGPDTELLIVGDTFGFWELTLVRGTDKLDHIIAAHQAHHNDGNTHWVYVLHIQAPPNRNSVPASQ